MFYRTDVNDHGLPHDPFKACVVPRPIGWISTMSPAGVHNLAPYSFFNGVATAPPMVMFASNGRQPHGAKDSLANVEETGEFVANLATWDLREAMNRSSAPLGPDVDEFAFAGLEALPAKLVRPARVAGAPVHLECVHHQTVDLPSNEPEGRNAIVIGQVVGVHIEDGLISDGILDLSRVQPLARLGYFDYTVVNEMFSISRPRSPKS
ncbi:MAG: flavin reductase family protein [Rhodospirillales bacterium]|nr:flavin reductase family protein [Rhodospirillales bacterium]MCY3855251.1 flavin reductase family protein [Rhodospirillales bacterium]MDE0374100.1 flavin reductase family protein [Rhodospirillales bacterium]MYE18914.1 flavin reductase family protein [Rhodospirillales bacterium]